jgi:hypothetical protein
MMMQIGPQDIGTGIVKKELYHPFNWALNKIMKAAIATDNLGLILYPTWSFCYKMKFSLGA